MARLVGDTARDEDLCGEAALLALASPDVLARGAKIAGLTSQQHARLRTCPIGGEVQNLGTGLLCFGFILSWWWWLTGLLVRTAGSTGR